MGRGRPYHPLFLQVKEARPSVIATYFLAAGPSHQGERVVAGQRLLQAANDSFLGWTTGPANRHFYFRQLRDMKVSAEVERMSNTVLQGYARMCGWALARTHAKAGGKAIEISSYIGSGERLADALASMHSPAPSKTRQTTASPLPRAEPGASRPLEMKRWRRIFGYESDATREWHFVVLPN